MSQRSMRAAYIDHVGDPDVIQVGDLPVPDPGPTDVLVRFEASAVNHVDTYIRSGAYQTPMPLPFIVGRDLVGVVDQVGVGAPGFTVGDRVWTNSLGHAGRQGAWSEFAVVASDRLYHAPSGVTAVDVAPHLHTATTAILGLTREAHVQPGQTVVVGGGAGGVGSAAVQIAVAMGARVIATASADDAAWCRELGAAAVIDYRARDMYAQVVKAAPEGIDVWWDTSGDHDFTATLAAVRPGACVIVTAARDTTPTLPIRNMYLRDVRLCGFTMSNASVTDLARAARALNAMLASGRLRTRLSPRLPLAQAAKAHRLMETGGLRGRLVIVP